MATQAETIRGRIVIKGRGLVVIIHDKSASAFHKEQLIAIQRPDGTILNATVRAIELFMDAPIAGVMLQESLGEQNVPEGSIISIQD